MSGWILPAAAIAVIALLLLMIGVFAGGATRRRAGAGAGSVVGVTLAVAVVWAVVSLAGGVIALVATLLLPEVQITVPVRTYWPELPAGTVVEGTTATRVGGGFESADLVVSGLSTGARGAWAISQLLWWLLPASIAAMIAVACSRLRGGRAFAPVVERTAMVTAVVVAAGGVAAQLLGDLAGSMASREVLDWTSGSWEEVAGVEDVLGAWVPHATFTMTLPFWPIAAGLAFAALAAVFRYGSRLQRETDLLV
jgi:hypothetical protein